MFAATTGKIDDRWRQFMGFQISRTRQIFADAEAGVDQLAPDARLPVWCDCFSPPRAHPLHVSSCHPFAAEHMVSDSTLRKFQTVPQVKVI